MTMVPGVLDPVVPRPVVGEDRTSTRRLYLPAFAVAGGTAWLLWFGAGTLDRSGSLGATLLGGWAELVAPMVVALVALLLFCERRWPAEHRPVRARGHVHDAVFFALHVAAVVPLMTLLGVAFAQLLGSHAGWLDAPWTGSWPRWLLLGVTLVLMDGANWLAHWADHRFAALWRMHALHHSQEEVNVLTSFRAHPLSHLAGFFLAAIPVIVLMGDRGMAPLLITGYVCLGTLPHTNVPWSFGPLGKVVVSPAYHRLHHSAEQSDGYNLGVVLTVWDVLAGRARFPVRGAPAFRTGLADRPLPVEQSDRTRRHLGLLFDQLVEPFRAIPARVISDRDRRETELVAAAAAPADGR
jgi:sterol desaturase/sphingolipid hydroxylase (fatty acid hydroxylase superfamily)